MSKRFKRDAETEGPCSRRRSNDSPINLAVARQVFHPERQQTDPRATATATMVQCSRTGLRQEPPSTTWFQSAGGRATLT